MRVPRRVEDKKTPLEKLSAPPAVVDQNGSPR
jgi:hypothetical protein